jgi:ribosome modulation factor
MKRHKRDMTQRAFQRGYSAGISGKPRESCPHVSTAQRAQWMGGWLEGKEANWSAMTAVSGISNLQKFTGT